MNEDDTRPEQGNSTNETSQETLEETLEELIELHNQAIQASPVDRTSKHPHAIAGADAAKKLQEERTELIVQLMQNRFRSDSPTMPPETHPASSNNKTLDHKRSNPFSETLNKLPQAPLHPKHPHYNNSFVDPLYEQHFEESERNRRAETKADTQAEHLIFQQPPSLSWKKIGMLTLAAIAVGLAAYLAWPALVGAAGIAAAGGIIGGIALLTTTAVAYGIRKISHQDKPDRINNNADIKMDTIDSNNFDQGPKQLPNASEDQAITPQTPHTSPDEPPDDQSPAPSNN